MILIKQKIDKQRNIWKARCVWTRNFLSSYHNLRYYSDWRRSLEGNTTSIIDRQPWMVYGAIHWLNQYLSSEMVVFEWGTGGSTLFISPKVRKLVSIEHDLTWQKKIEEVIAEEKITNIHLIYCEIPENDQVGNERASNYVKEIDNYADGEFDLVIIDGRERMACLDHAINKVKKGGFILLDDSEREKYLPAFEKLSDWKERRFYGLTPHVKFFKETTIWQKEQ